MPFDCKCCTNQPDTKFYYKNIVYNMTEKNKKTFLCIGKHVVSGCKLTINDKRVLLYLGNVIINKTKQYLTIEIDFINKLTTITKSDEINRKNLISKLYMIKTDKFIKGDICMSLEYAKKFVSALYINEVD